MSYINKIIILLIYRLNIMQILYRNIIIIELVNYKEIISL
mgnify:CR=1 FL=1